jgi:hypothetical protein
MPLCIALSYGGHTRTRSFTTVTYPKPCFRDNYNRQMCESKSNLQYSPKIDTNNALLLIINVRVTRMRPTFLIRIQLATR